MADAKIKYRLKGHESFILREGWLTKGLFAVSANPRLFSENFGADELGVGTNMAKSIRYWMRCAGLLEENKGQATLSTLGSCLLKQDAYLEDIFSLWLVHCNIVCNFEQASTWYAFFNLYDRETFAKKDLDTDLKEILLERTQAAELSERSIQDDNDAILQMYAKKRDHGVNPEEKKVSPFYRLGLLKEQDGVYRREQPDLRKLDARLVLYVMQDILEKEQDYYQVSIEKLLLAEGAPGRILQLRRSFLMQYLEELEQKNYITLNRTAGLDMVYQKKKYTREEIIQEYFGGE